MRTISVAATIAVFFLFITSKDDATVSAKVQAPQFDLSQLDGIAEVQDGISDLEIRVSKLEDQVCDCNCGPDCGCGGPKPEPPKVEKKPTASPAVTSQAKVSPKWMNTDGRTLRNHMVEVHGFSTSMSDGAMIQAHDAWHDQNGGEPPSPARSRSRTVTYSSSSCPGGVCPAPGVTRSYNVQSNGGIFGFGILGRRR